MIAPEQGKSRAWLGALALLGMLAPATAPAHDLNITAIFKPDPANPLKNEFRNTTQQSGYCDQLPAYCVNPPLVSFRVPIGFVTSEPIPAHHPWEFQGVMLQVPGQWRRLQVTHTATGKTEEVEVRVAGIGTVHESDIPVQTLVGDPVGTSSYTSWGKLWEGGNWVNGVGPCKSTGYHGASSWIYGFFLRVEEVDGVCAKKALFDIPLLRYAFLDVGYQLRTPRPLDMATGVYVGTMHYNVGPGGDISAGNNLLPRGDNQINLNFTLTVEHELKIDVPPGGHRVVLEPQGGWQAWLQHGRKPVRLFRDQTFNMHASSRFKMLLECEFQSGNTCAIENSATHRVPLDIRVTLPSGLVDGAGAVVAQRPLRLDGAGTELFQPTFYVERQAGTLHFEVPSSAVESMLTQGASAYRGQATVIWDSEV
ncbi:hypothetical protein [Pseudomonas sp.]|jgi:hypothetical protein|uniref:hypothetical protein n=1 Tax=Pseudomonas sp. TaxID=306 RepID=UPI002E35B4AE|nr:hypothetical protein [Pseudomonas sp.]HEX4551841.1 hypothetical protein [Pseudomonas sp.]